MRLGEVREWGSGFVIYRAREILKNMVHTRVLEILKTVHTRVLEILARWRDERVSVPPILDLNLLRKKTMRYIA